MHRRPLRAALRGRLRRRRRRAGDRRAAARRAAPARARRRLRPARLAAVAGRVRDAARRPRRRRRDHHAGRRAVRRRLQRPRRRRSARASGRCRTFVVRTFPITRGQLEDAVAQLQQTAGRQPGQPRLRRADHRRHRRRGHHRASSWRCSRSSSSSRTAGRSGCGWSACSPATPAPTSTRRPAASWRTLISYVRATVAVALVDAIGIGIGLAILGVPLVIPLAALVFLGAFIPIIGSFLAGIVAVLVALVSKGPITALIALGDRHRWSCSSRGTSCSRCCSAGPSACTRSPSCCRIAAGLLIAGIFGALIAVPIVACAQRRRHLPEPAARGAAATRPRRRPAASPRPEGPVGPQPSQAEGGPGRGPRSADSMRPRRRPARCRCASARRPAAPRPPARRRSAGRRRGRRRAAITASTRPPAETTAPSAASAVPACSTPSPSAPVIGSPVRGALGVARARRPRRSPRRRRASAAAGARPACRSRRRAAARPAASPAAASTTWVSGSPKRALNSTTRTPARGQRQPGVEQPGERRAAAGHLVDGRLQHRGQHLVDQAGRRPRQRRVGAHAAGVRARRRRRRPRLKSWAGSSGTTVVPSVIANSDTSGPSRNSSIDRPARTAGARARAAASRSSVTTTPLPAASPSSLTTYGGAELVERGRHLGRASCTTRARGGRHAGGGHHVLGEGLASPRAGRPAATGRSRRCPASRTASATPATSGASGPITTRSAPPARRPARRPRRGSAASTASGSATARDAGVAGRAGQRASPRGRTARATHRACSRAPEPITSTRTEPNLPTRTVTAVGWAASRHARRWNDAQPRLLRGPGPGVDPQQLAVRLGLQLAPRAVAGRGPADPSSMAAATAQPGSVRCSQSRNRQSARQRGDVGVGGVHALGVVVAARARACPGVSTSRPPPGSRCSSRAVVVCRPRPSLRGSRRCRRSRRPASAFTRLDFPTPDGPTIAPGPARRQQRAHGVQRPRR